MDDPRLLELADRMKRLEASVNDVPLYQSAVDTRIPPAENIELISSEASLGSTRVAIRWIRPSNANIDHFEIWVKRTAFDAESPYLVASVVDSPAAFTVSADKNTTAVASIRTVMKNGLSTDLALSPTVAFQVYATMGTDSVTDSALDRSSANKIKIIATDIESVNPATVQAGDTTNVGVSLSRNGIRTRVTNFQDGSDYVGVEVRRDSNTERVTVTPNKIFLYAPNGTIAASFDGAMVNLQRAKLGNMTVAGGVYGMVVIKSAAGNDYYLWIDSTGRLRVKQAAPISDTDGTVVGTQT